MDALAHTEPSARGRILIACRAAALEIWREKGVLDIAARLPADIRRRVLEQKLEPLSWIPEEDLVRWYEAVWNGPAEGRQDVFVDYAFRVSEHGIGRTRRLLLRVISPDVLVKRASALWRQEHTHGELSVEVKGTGATLTLRDSIYATDPLLRLVLVEVYRYALSRSRSGEVELKLREGSPNAFVVDIRWS